MIVTKKFPYITEPNVKSGLKFSFESVAMINRIINFPGAPDIPVTCYPCKSEYKYAIETSLRYATVDMIFKVGKVVSFDLHNYTVDLDVKDEYADRVTNGKVLLRALISKQTESEELCMKLNRLIAIDILEQEG